MKECHKAEEASGHRPWWPSSWMSTTSIFPSQAAPRNKSQTRSLAQGCHQTADHGPEREWEEGTPGTAATAVRIDIQAWLIYGVGEIVPLLWGLHEQKILAVSTPFTYSNMTLRSQDFRLYTYIRCYRCQQFIIVAVVANQAVESILHQSAHVHKLAVLFLGSDHAWLVDPFHWTSLCLWHDGSLA